MALVDHAFEAEAIIVDEKSALVSFDIDPTTVGFEAPLGSFGMRTNGNQYRKIGVTDTDWESIGGARYLLFGDRSGANANISILDIGGGYELVFFNRAGGADNIAII